MPVFRIICCVDVTWVAWWEVGRGMRRSGCVWLGRDAWVLGKCGEASKAWRGPPSRERETWIFVSLVMRESEESRRVN